MSQPPPPLSSSSSSSEESPKNAKVQDCRQYCDGRAEKSIWANFNRRSHNHKCRHDGYNFGQDQLEKNEMTTLGHALPKWVIPFLIFLVGGVTTTLVIQVTRTTLILDGRGGEDMKSLLSFLNKKTMNKRRRLSEDSTLVENKHNDKDGNEINNNEVKNNDDTNTFRILYIMNSSSRSNDRWEKKMIPVLLDSIESLLQTNVPNSLFSSDDDIDDEKKGKDPKHVGIQIQLDVYLVLGYTITQEEEENLRAILHNQYQVGLEVWQDAFPLTYHCEKYDVSVIAGTGSGKCSTKPSIKRLDGVWETAAVGPGTAQLARQHRYVVKDKLPYYDFFLAFEDDMLLHHQHVETYLYWRDRVLKVQQRLEKEQFTTAANNQQYQSKHNSKWKNDLTIDQLEHLRPGFIRVEVLQPTAINAHKLYHHRLSNKKATLDNISSSSSSSLLDFHPSTCCNHANRLVPNTESAIPNMEAGHAIHKSDPPTEKEQVLIWETGTLGFAIRPFPSFKSSSISKIKLSSSTISEKNENNDDKNNNNHWMALLPGPSGRDIVDGYWTGDVPTIKSTHVQGKQQRTSRPTSGAPEYLAQSAGWMASAQDVMDYHTKYCGGGFVPPFPHVYYNNNRPTYDFARDGLWKHNVEFWSGGIQLWCGKCSMNRFVILDNNDGDAHGDEGMFSKHFLYHTSNNKQYTKPLERMTLVQDLYEELQISKDYASLQ